METYIAILITEKHISILIMETYIALLITEKYRKKLSYSATYGEVFKQLQMPLSTSVFIRS